MGFRQSDAYSLTAHSQLFAMSEKINLRFGILVLLIVAAALSRLLPHPFNFTPIGAMALFGAAYFSNRVWAVALPFAAMWLSDLWLNNVTYNYTEGFQWMGSAWVYGSFFLISGLGFLLLRHVKVGTVLGTSLLASVLFFLITNFAVWYGSTTYPQNIGGLLLCYEAGIPFFGNTLAGDLFYCAVLFGGFEWAQRRVPALSRAMA